ncbi:MAG TPA: tetratricopeptide repeat protein [Vicinamibacterales bacterium]|jgi:predicted membrane-bound spermidine synthase
MPYLLFFGSGASALIYEVVWVRVFANVFGNTIYSASIVTAVFMLGLGIGSYAAGVWADRRYAASPAPSAVEGLAPSAVEGRPDSMLHVFASLEFVIGVLGLAISLLLPHLGDLSAAVSSYTRGADGWYVLSFSSYAARTAIAVALLAPSTLLMGGTLTVLIRHCVRTGADLSGPCIALLYGVNTLGAAIGCVLTDFTFVPAYGLRATQMIAVAINLATAAGALAVKSQGPNPKPQVPKNLRIPNPGSRIPVIATAVALAMTGFAGMGMEILWFRHFSILLGEFRAVFALLLAIILLGIGAGSLAGAYLQRRFADPARTLIVIQGLFVAATLLGLASADARALKDAAAASGGGQPHVLAELWFNARPIVLIAGLPVLLMGFAFPLANAIVQRAHAVVGRRAGALYLANTFGAVCGSLATGFLLLPALGIQRSATVLMVAAGLAIVPLVRPKADSTAAVESGFSRTVGASLLIAIAALATWLLLPADYLLSRALLFPPQRAYTISEGVTELIAVTDGPDGGRVLVTNGHPMSSTALLSQRYMRAMAHIPLLAIDNPQRVLVLCYGVGNTARAATLHPTVAQVDIVDLSRHVLDHSSYFNDVNGDVLHDPHVSVYINDGRHHLQMGAIAGVEAGLQTGPGPYDLITLEPPPIVHAGVAALYTTEFYERARARLTPKGYISQWLPAFGVPQSMILSMVRSFVDVFPNAVLLSGASSNLLLVGANDARNEIDPDRLVAALRNAPAAQMDLQRLDLGTPREIIGMFVGSSRTLVNATRDVAPVTDDRPIQEYGRRSLLEYDEPIPASIVDVGAVGDWCPRCLDAGNPAPAVEGLDTYLALLNLAYTAPPRGPARAAATGAGTRPIAGSGYLRAVIPESSQLDSILEAAFVQNYQRGTDLLVGRHYPGAIDSFRAALTWNPESVQAHNNLGIALASLGRMDEAVAQFRQALAIEPAFEDAKRNLALATRR